jgi:hypothetical protein
MSFTPREGGHPSTELGAGSVHEGGEGHEEKKGKKKGMKK